ncbi:M48 family metallopeptidase [Flavobacterium sp. NKUCC04_CG]|uniref:M48 family metallopeptidase n=1 Tax=Flavobacterium sp. NKUCC04_CG TaxID=2842121 RepID=UPI001C5BAFFC|nr:M48 family metallopeptidase [Flavobacterium sp. NKUCC04_CG]MBW3519626.1 M48 family metallopeptidase [Flavobacterium sp. NKUCC04_CG]
MMKKIFLTATVLLAVSCATNPFTGAKTMALVNDSSLFPSSFQQYDSFLKEHKVIKGTKDAQRVENVGKKIKAAAEKWLDANGYKGYLSQYQWDYNLVDDKEVNAWCMPGGKIVFYTGILPICRDDAGMATVMGHEVAHALANHGQQRMSAGMLQQAGAEVLTAATTKTKASTKDLLMSAYGGGSNVLGMLPFSRNHETEADKIGLTLMAIAGYNPDAAVDFWARMAANSSGSEPAEFMSTHPSNQSRIDNLKRLIPEAKAEAAKFGVKF